MSLKASIVGSRELKVLFRILGLRDAYSLEELHEALGKGEREHMIITTPEFSESIRSKISSHLPELEPIIVSISVGEEGLPMKLISKALGVKVDVRHLVGVRK